MRALVTASARFATTSDGVLWTQNPSLRYSVSARYLDVYDEIDLLVRAQLHSAPPNGWLKASGPGVKPIAVPYFVGPWEFVKNYVAVKKVIRAALADAEAIQMRLPCSIGSEVCNLLAPGRPYGVEVVADPYDTFALGSVKHPLRPLFRWWFPHKLRQECAQACAVAYVTKEALQQRYPCPNYSVGISDVELPEVAFVSAPRPLRQGARTFTLIFVGSLAQLYKAPNVLINAVALCSQEGLDLKLILVGDGKHRAELEAQAEELGIGKRVCFRGQLSLIEAVREEFDRADLFILPSYQEGLPKAMVEAMARALPCIGSTVGGIPELLPPEDMVQPGDVAALARKIREVVTNPERMARMSALNLKKAKEYEYEVLRQQRNEFYRYVREKTQAWQQAQKK
jgi:glycosyltransferase involved in cell wall biosynthesis